MSIGTQADNVRDMDAKGRSNRPHGSATGKAKLSETAVIEMRKQYAGGGYSFEKIAAMYNVELMTAYSVITGRTWAHVGGPVEEAKAISESRRCPARAKMKKK